MIQRLSKLIKSRAEQYDPLDCRGGGRFMLSTYEEHVFALAIENVPYLAETFQAYEALKGAASDEYSRNDLLCKGIFRQFPEIRQRLASKMEFMVFCMEVTDKAGADAFYDKIQWWDRRAGKTMPAVPADATL